MRVFISIHSPHAGRDADDSKRPAVLDISIHSPHAGRDRPPQIRSGRRRHFNPLSPRGERPDELGISPRTVQFQSTLPTRGETYLRLIHSVQQKKFQSTLPAWGETRALGIIRRWMEISIHSPRMGRDAETSRQNLPAGISIHSPRMGRDLQ